MSDEYVLFLDQIEFSDADQKLFEMAAILTKAIPLNGSNMEMFEI